MPPLDLNDAQRLKKLVLDPLIETLRAEMRAGIHPVLEELRLLRDRDKGHDSKLVEFERRIDALERFKLKIAAICSVIALATGIVWRWALDWVRSWIFKPR